MTKEEIMLEINNLYSAAINVYGEDRLLGGFAVGNLNYGLAEQVSEIDIVAFYIPTFEELCTTAPFKNEQVNSRILIRDIRSMYELLNIHSNLLMEALLTEYYIVNPKYENPVNDLRERTEDIYKFDPNNRIKHAAQTGLAMIKKYVETDDTKYIVNAQRIIIAIDLYKLNLPCKKCLTLEQYNKQLLLHAKHGDITIQKEYLIDIFNSILDNPDCINREYNKSIPTFIKGKLLEIGRIAMTDGKESIDFLKELTENEKKAFRAIGKAIDYKEGNIIISQLIKETEISRPVFTSLLNKLTMKNIIETTSQGVKGTRIKILNSTIKQALQLDRNK